MDVAARSYLSSHGFENIIDDLSQHGVKSLGDIQKMTSEELAGKTSLKRFGAEKLLDMLQNRSHPKSSTGASSGFGTAEDHTEPPTGASIELPSADQIQQEQNLRSWLSSINPCYARYARQQEQWGRFSGGGPFHRPLSEVARLSLGKEKIENSFPSDNWKPPSYDFLFERTSP